MLVLLGWVFVPIYMASGVCKLYLTIGKLYYLKPIRLCYLSDIYNAGIPTETLWREKITYLLCHSTNSSHNPDWNLSKLVTFLHLCVA